MSTQTIPPGVIETYTGAFVDPLNLENEPPGKIRLPDIAASLAKQCRYAGHCRRFYSVAEHCVLASRLVETELNGNHDANLGALLHDASEAYLVDLPRPIKSQLSEYRAAEDSAQRAIYKKFRVVIGVDERRMIDAADDFLLAEEAFCLMPSRGAGWPSLQAETAIPRGRTLFRFLDPERAEAAFIARFVELTL